MNVWDTVFSVLPWAATGAVLALLCLLVWRYFVREPDAPWKGAPMPLGNLCVWTIFMFLLSRALILAVPVCAFAAKGQLVSFLRDPLSCFLRWDANHYLGLAENWYAATGDARLHIVFFPLYPALVRATAGILPIGFAWSGVLVSNASLLGATVALWRLVELDYGSDTAKKAARLFLFSPLSLIFSLPFSESVFFLTTVLAVWMAKKRRLAPAILFGILSANARLLGLLTAIPVFYIFYSDARKRGAKAILRVFSAVCLIALGFVAYLYLNYRVTGDPFKFLAYQKDHWSQSFGSLQNTLTYTLQNARVYEDAMLRIGTWIPQAAYILGVLVLLCRTVWRTCAGDASYALFYLYFAVSPTWLLSGARYLTALYAIYPMLALLGPRRWQHQLLLLASLALGIYFTYCYAIIGCVM